MEKIFNFNDIDKTIDEVKSRPHSSSYSEIQIFKDFALKYLQDKNTKSNLLKNYWFSNDYKIKNIDKTSKDESSSQIDIYFINKTHDNKNIIFIVEIKDLSLKTLKIFNNYQFVSEKVDILEKDIILSETILPMFDDQCIFIRINIAKFSEKSIQYNCYEYNRKTINDVVGDLTSYRCWKKLDKKKLKTILKTTTNQNLNYLNLELLKRNAYDRNMLKSLLTNYNNKCLVRNICFSVGNIKLLAEGDFENCNRMLIKINGCAGSGKTFFAFLLFITEQKVFLIVSNVAFFKEFNKLTKQIESINNNKFILIKDLLYGSESISISLKKYKYIVIDESQNIDNYNLMMIANICHDNGIKLFLLSDYKQNVYAWKNLRNFYSSNKLLEKQNELENNLKKLYKVDEIKFDWDYSNRFNTKDLRKIEYLVFGDISKLESYQKNTEEKSILNIYPCDESNLHDLRRKYSRRQIFIVSHFNWMDTFNKLVDDEYDFYNQYQHIGYEYDDLVIYLPNNFEYDENSKRLIYHFQNHENGLDTILPDDALNAWLYVAFTRATKSIRIFVDPTNKYKTQICEYFNKRLQNLKPKIENNNFIC